MIAHALEQWETVTGRLVTITPDFKMGGGHHPINNPIYKDCTPFPIMPITGSVLTQMEQGWFVMFVEEDNQINEIRMLDFPPEGADIKASMQELFIVADPLKGCMLFTNTACAAPAPNYDDGRLLQPPPSVTDYVQYVLSSPDWLPDVHPAAILTSSDILINETTFTNIVPNLPGDVVFNSCVMGAMPDSDDHRTTDHFYAYATVVHEGGHALGLAGRAGLGLLLDDYTAAHAATPGSVMNYDENDLTDVLEPDCAPHPLDVLAIYALYQTLLP